MRVKFIVFLYIFVTSLGLAHPSGEEVAHSDIRRIKEVLPLVFSYIRESGASLRPVACVDRLFNRTVDTFFDLDFDWAVQSTAAEIQKTERMPHIVVILSDIHEAIALKKFDLNQRDINKKKIENQIQQLQKLLAFGLEREIELLPIHDWLEWRSLLTQVDECAKDGVNDPSYAKRILDFMETSPEAHKISECIFGWSVLLRNEKAAFDQETLKRLLQNGSFSDIRTEIFKRLVTLSATNQYEVKQILGSLKDLEVENRLFIYGEMLKKDLISSEDQNEILNEFFNLLERSNPKQKGILLEHFMLSPIFSSIGAYSQKRMIQVILGLEKNDPRYLKDASNKYRGQIRYSFIKAISPSSETIDFIFSYGGSSVIKEAMLRGLSENQKVDPEIRQKAKAQLTESSSSFLGSQSLEDPVDAFYEEAHQRFVEKFPLSQPLASLKAMFQDSEAWLDSKNREQVSLAVRFLTTAEKIAITRYALKELSQNRQEITNSKWVRAVHLSTHILHFLMVDPKLPAEARIHILKFLAQPEMRKYAILIIS